ncbi:6-phosphogluconolactonase [Caballeronia terrestris]|uniref:6-phosphogluconolactonase n=1 Tax=Caballeronia terrestris TaxID=1226301 RepID=A0A158G4V9_9BURK|nr:beta-propeller fold lactonase family protein [Caballeronia terrestris]SAL26933.1 6-phosphogluconolactonase [Caballeronia terrestris]
MMELKNLAIASACAALLSACGGSDGDSAPAASVKQLYAQTNETNNSVLQFDRNPDGTLAPRGRIATGGKGTNGVNYFQHNGVIPDALTSNHSVIVSADEKRLFVANAGDNTVSVFDIDQRTGELRLRKANPTGGIRPTSLSLKDDILYVTHQEGEKQLGAYKVGLNGSLTKIGDYATLPGDALLTEVEVSPDHRSVVVNGFLDGVNPRKPGKTIMTFPIHADGTLGKPTSTTSLGMGPFGGRFGNGKLGHVYLTAEAGSGTLSTYTLNNGKLEGVSGPIAVTGQGAPCWLVVSPDNRFVYTGDGSGAVSLFSLDADGRATLVNGTAAEEPPPASGVSNTSLAADAWISADGKFLYQDYFGADKIVSYAIQPDGSLVKVGEQAANTETHVSLQGLVGI